MAQSGETQTIPDATEAQEQVHAFSLGGPSSVIGQLSKDRKAKGAFYPLPDLLERYSRFKNRVEEEYGFSFGFDYSFLLQYATQSPGEDTAAGGAFRAFGRWALVGRGTQNTGALVYKFENRHRLGTDIAPTDLGNEIGYAGLTALPFSNVGWVLTNLYWSQQLLNNRLAFAGGIVDVTDYVDVYGLVNPWTDFNNYAFTTNPTIPAPDQGLGTAVRVMASDNIYIVAGIADANGDPTDIGDSVNSFFSDSEFFTHLEIGWASSWERRFSDNIHLTAWHADAREEAQLPSGWGVAFSFSRLFANTWEPFFRVGYSENGGALWDRSASAGLGYYPGKTGNILGVGLNWSRPAKDVFGPGLDDQYTAEAYYRFQLLEMLAIKPSVQFLVNPALDPDESAIWVFGLWMRLAL